MGKNRLRCAALLATTVAVEVVLAASAPGAWQSVTEPAPATLPADRAGALLAGLLVLVAAAVWSHWCLLLVATATGDRACARLATRLAPGTWRAAAGACLGLAVTIGATGPAAAATTSAVGTDPTGPRLDGLPLPDRPVGGWGRSAATGTATSTVTGTVVTVRAGDTLWSLAADRLPANAGNARIDRAWRAWYAANRGTVGKDPDLLLPGQRLVPPAAPERTPR